MSTPPPWAGDDILDSNPTPTWRDASCCTVVAETRGSRSVALSAARGDEDDSTSLAAPGAAVPALADHLRDVGTRAMAFATQLGLDNELVRAVGLAARAHDLGKLHPRFQRWLQGGTEDLWPGVQEPIAKSTTRPDLWGRTARLAGWPRSLRHEALSVALFDSYMTAAAQVDDDPLDGITDVDLIRHLVGTHHGYGRPIYRPTPIAADDIKGQFQGIPVELTADDIPTAALDWEAPQRFQTLVEMYGPWGLALLETIVRLADMSCSEAGL